MLNTARTTCLVGLVDLYQTELYQDSTYYNELEKSRLLMIFFCNNLPRWRVSCYTSWGILLHIISFVTCRTYIINAHDLLMNDLNPPPSFEHANVSIFLITYQAFTINFNIIT